MAWSVPRIGAVATPVASGNYTLTEPTGSEPIDLQLACFALRSTVGFTNDSWTLVESQLAGDTDATNGIAACQMWWRVRGASAGNLVFSRTGGDLAIGCIIGYAPTAGFAPVLGNHASQTLGAANATANAPTITTVDAGELIVAMCGLGDTGSVTSFDAATDPTTISSGTDTTNAPSNGQWRMRLTSGSGTGADGTLGIGDALRATAGATGLVSMLSSITAQHAGAVAAFRMAAIIPPPTLPYLMRQALKRAYTR